MKSLKEFINTRTKLEKINSHITYIWFKLIAPFVVVLFILVYAFYHQMKYRDDLKNRDTFICKSYISDQFVIIVDKKDGWRVKGDYFIKGNNKILIKKCKTLEEKNHE